MTTWAEMFETSPRVLRYGIYGIHNRGLTTTCCVVTPTIIALLSGVSKTVFMRPEQEQEALEALESAMDMDRLDVVSSRFYAATSVLMLTRMGILEHVTLRLLYTGFRFLNVVTPLTSDRDRDQIAEYLYNIITRREDRRNKLFVYCTSGRLYAFWV